LEWSEVPDSVQELGRRYVVWGYPLPAERGSSPAGYRRLADAINAAGSRYRDAGLQFCYHNHAVEFGGRPGERLIDILVERLDPPRAVFSPSER
jgi:hypothetical protein